MRRCWIILCCIALAACGGSGEPSSPIVEAHVRAFNDRDLAAMAALQHEDVQWYAVGDDGAVALEINGRAALGEMMTGYAAANPTARGALSGWSVNGNWVAVTETATWTDDQGRARSQDALAVYQMQDGSIRRVWYYPAVTGA